jgi:hypothetical protein
MPPSGDEVTRRLRCATIARQENLNSECEPLTLHVQPVKEHNQPRNGESDREKIIDERGIFESRCAMVEIECILVACLRAKSENDRLIFTIAAFSGQKRGWIADRRPM